MSKMVTPKVQGAFLNLKDAKIAPGGDEDSAKFGLTIVLPQDDAWWKELNAKIKEVAKEKFGKIPAKCVLPVKDGDDTDYPEFEGMFTANVASKRRPEIVGRNRKPIIDIDDIGSGDYFRVSLVPYAWTFSDQGLTRRGVSLSLSNVMWVGESGERWDGSTSADSDFADIEEEDGDADDLLD